VCRCSLSISVCVYVCGVYAVRIWCVCLLLEGPLNITWQQQDPPFPSVHPFMCANLCVYVCVCVYVYVC